MANIKLLHGEEGYRLQVGEEISEEADYGEPLHFKGHLVYVDLDEDEAPCTPLDSLVYRGTPVECEEVETAEAEEGGEADEEDADDDPEENEQT